MLKIGMWWEIPEDRRDEMFSKLVKVAAPTYKAVYRCSSNHVRTASQKFCPDCGAPVEKKQESFPPDLEDVQQDFYDNFHCDEDSVFLELYDLHWAAILLNDDLIKKYEKEFESRLAEDEDFSKMCSVLTEFDTPSLSIYDDGYYSREWDDR